MLTHLKINMVINLKQGNEKIQRKSQVGLAGMKCGKSAVSEPALSKPNVPVLRLSSLRK